MGALTGPSVPRPRSRNGDKGRNATGNAENHRRRYWPSLKVCLRALLGYDRELCAEVVSALVGELSRSLKKRAKRELSLAIVAQAHTGAVCAVQRTDSALRLNVHFHVLALDGVYRRDGESGALIFEQLDTPSRAEVLDVARRTAERVDGLLRQSGRAAAKSPRTCIANEVSSSK